MYLNMDEDMYISVPYGNDDESDMVTLKIKCSCCILCS